MDIKPVIARLVSDCDMRNRALRNCQDIFADYVLCNGRIKTIKEAEQSETFNYHFGSMNCVGQRVRA